MITFYWLAMEKLERAVNCYIEKLDLVQSLDPCRYPCKECVRKKAENIANNWILDLKTREPIGEYGSLIAIFLHTKDS